VVTRSWLTLVVAFTASIATPAAGQDLVVTAPPTLEVIAARLRTLDWRPLTSALSNAGLDVPPTVRVTLIDESDSRASATPWWVVGLASGTEDVVIFPERAGSYPYESLESVLRHEVVHLALSARAGDGAIPRWFHEGVAVSVETDWNVGGDVRLVLAAARNPGMADLARLFNSHTYLGSADAYRLAAALVNDIRERHGPATPGRIAARVAADVPFDKAFQLETGETPDAATARVWAQYRRWTAWLPVVTSESAVWTVILALAFVAFVAQVRKRARRRRQWAEEEEFPRE
jgi:hypothetical protein